MKRKFTKKPILASAENSAEIDCIQKKILEFLGGDDTESREFSRVLADMVWKKYRKCPVRITQGPPEPRDVYCTGLDIQFQDSDAYAYFIWDEYPEEGYGVFLDETPSQITRLFEDDEDENYDW